MTAGTRITIRFLRRDRVNYRGGAHVSDVTYDLPPADLSHQTLRWLAYILAASPEDSQQEAFLRVVGLNLFERIFPDSDVAYAARQDFIYLCDRGHVGISLIFDKEARALAQLPWEFLYVPVGDGFFLADPNRQLTLTREVGGRAFPPAATPLRVLVAVSSPEGPRARVPQYDLETLLNDLRKDCRNRLLPKFMPLDATWEQLEQTIGEFRPDIFHFRGHGESGGLWLAKAYDEVKARLRQVEEQQKKGLFSPEVFDSGELIEVAGVAKLFDRHQPSLIVLEACESANVVDNAFQFLPRVATDLLARVPAVVAMQYKIAITTAGSFIGKLYRNVAEGRVVDEAVAMARASLTRGQPNTAEFADRAFGAPVLYVGSHGPMCERLLGDLVARCSSCGYDAPDDESNTPMFCSQCGFRLHYRCPHCMEVTGVRTADRRDWPQNCWRCHTAFQVQDSTLSSPVDRSSLEPLASPQSEGYPLESRSIPEIP